ncbi:unnamed protein product [Enterobius vermicularis]|uniref:WH1 domain-containing protein n=1 Tax=Enterobius vermicularis TaxID=51028 RepID=A0A0N4V8K3_ENTVE|nr:unnamed protein product [Enterobius vermicularis]
MEKNEISRPFRQNEQPRLKKRERPSNTGSSLLTDVENATFFGLLGNGRYSLAAGIIELLRSDPRRPNQWMHQSAGIIALVKDYEKRAYFLRLYDPYQRQCKWQQML